MAGVAFAVPAGRWIGVGVYDGELWTGILALEGIEELAGPIRGAVVEDEYLGVRVALGKERADTGGDRGRLVAGGDKNTDARERAWRLRGEAACGAQEAEIGEQAETHRCKEREGSEVREASDECSQGRERTGRQARTGKTGKSRQMAGH